MENISILTKEFSPTADLFYPVLSSAKSFPEPKEVCLRRHTKSSVAVFPRTKRLAETFLSELHIMFYLIILQYLDPTNFFFSQLHCFCSFVSQTFYNASCLNSSQVSMISESFLISVSQLEIAFSIAEIWDRVHLIFFNLGCMFG